MVNKDNINKLQPGQITIHLGDYHLYEDHYDQAIIQILRTPYKFANLNIQTNRNNIEEFKFEDIQLTNYKCHSGILAKMVA